VQYQLIKYREVTMKTAVILAGGISRRMGYDKQLIEYGDDKLLVMQVNKLKSMFDRILIVSNNHIIDDWDFPCSVEIVSDVMKGYGPLGGIYTATHHVQGWFYLIACDMPNIDLAFIQWLYQQPYTLKDVVVSKYGDWIEPFHGLYNSCLKETLGAYLRSGGRSIHKFVENHRVLYLEEAAVREWTPDWLLFDNINTKEDLERQTVI